MQHRLVKMLGGAAPWLMGVVNVTPDSFSDGGQLPTAEAATAHGRALLDEGAQLLDIGGESTAPGSRPIPAETELARIEPVVRALARETVLSIDTYHAVTAERCLVLGARVINDVSALRADPGMVDVIRDMGAVLVMMHAKDGPLPHATDRPAPYKDVVREIGDWLERRVDVALKGGLIWDQLVLDPGWGRFVSLDPAHSFELLGRMAELVARFRPIPLLVGTSRKGFLGVPLAERDPISQLTSLDAVRRGVALVRTHNVRMARQFLEIARRTEGPTRPGPSPAR